MNRLEYNKYRGWTIPEDENPAEEGFLVEYTDSPSANHPKHNCYISWSPKDVFERAYKPTDGLTFGLALEALKQGKRVARAGWNGMFLFLLPAGTIPTKAIHDAALRNVIEEQVGGETFEGLATIRMWTADKKILTGWLASQTDMLSEDWFVIE